MKIKIEVGERLATVVCSSDFIATMDVVFIKHNLRPHETIYISQAGRVCVEFSDVDAADKHNEFPITVYSIRGKDHGPLGIGEKR